MSSKATPLHRYVCQHDCFIYLFFYDCFFLKFLFHCLLDLPPRLQDLLGLSEFLSFFFCYGVS